MPLGACKESARSESPVVEKSSCVCESVQEYSVGLIQDVCAFACVFRATEVRGTESLSSFKCAKLHFPQKSHTDTDSRRGPETKVFLSPAPQVATYQSCYYGDTPLLLLCINESG